MKTQSTNPVHTTQTRDWSRTPAAMVSASILGIVSISGVLWSMQSKPIESTDSIVEHLDPNDVPPARLQLDLNSATIDQLNLLPNIGPTLAKRIIEYRDQNGPYESLKDLDNVKGIGPKTIDRIEEWVIVSAP